jgi:hypothetical protein
MIGLNTDLSGKETVMRRGQGRVFWCVAGAFLIAAAVSAGEAPQTMVARAAALASGEPAVPGVVPDWGTTGVSEYSIGSTAFVPLASSVDYTYSLTSSGYQRWATSGVGVFDDSLHLPSGAKILGVEVDGCDSSAASELQLGVFADPASNSLVSITVAFLQTGNAAVPGCATFIAPALVQATVLNSEFAYTAEVYTGALSSETSFKGARIAYQLQVSPAPASATFADVPMAHPLFQYVEALAASGITAGCNAENYCPDSAVTRGQLAVFFAKALGLHFAP